MAAGTWFWLLYVICVLFGMWSDWPIGQEKPNYRPLGGRLVVFILLGLLGWAVFGSPLK